MKKEMLISLKNKIINAAIILNILLGIEIIALANRHNLKLFSDFSNYYTFLNPNTIFLHRTLSVIIGLVLIFISYSLYKRMKIAWIISIIMLSISALVHILEFHSFFRIINVTQLIVIIIFSINFKDFRRSSDPISVKRGFG